MKRYRWYRVGLAVTIMAVGMVQCFGVANSQISRSTRLHCKLNQSLPLKSTRRYGLLGDDEFETLVCGHIVTRQQEFFGDTVTVAYFRILKAADQKFLAAIQREISNGNDVNFIEKNHYHFNLGCFDRGKIIGTVHNPRLTYITPKVQAALLKSSPQRPVTLILSFGRHAGMGCECCNLAHMVRSI